MSIKSSLQGRLRNTTLKPNTPLLPLFEAVVNSIVATSDANLKGEDGLITIRIRRDLEPIQQSLSFGRGKVGAPKQEDIIGFDVTDNGIGFNDANLDSFTTLDSMYKASEGGKGIGRLTWLKAFDNVSVDSTFVGKGRQFGRRTFTFSEASDGVGDLVEDAGVAGPAETTIHLRGFHAAYRSEAPKTAQAIARRLLDHCLWYFIRPGGAPRILIIDGSDSLSMRNVYDEYMRSSIQDETITIKGRDFDLDHIKLKSTAQSEHFIAFCANGREVKHEKVTAAKIPGLRGPIKDEEGEFIYACYVTSPYLDESVRPERIGFDIPETEEELFSQDVPAMSEIETGIIDAATRYLNKYLQDLRNAGRKRVEGYVQNKAIRYRSILRYLSEADFWVDPDISDKELESRLHDKWYEVEKSLLEDGHDVLKFVSNETRAEYERRIEKYKQKVEAIKQSDLADYVFHRKVVLEILEQLVKKRADGKYEQEFLVHELVMPMRKTSEEVETDQANLWLIDERLTFHHFLASDKPIESFPIVDTGDGTEPDICILDVMDEPLLVSDKADPPATLTIIEFKRPMREDVGRRDEDPIEQTLGYLTRIRSGGMKTKDGRLILNAKDTPGFCYVVCDFTEKMIECCIKHNLRPWRDGLAYFGYHDNYKAYIEVISFNQLVKAAKERNYAFFHHLGLPSD
jgi:hypothetical protein